MSQNTLPAAPKRSLLVILLVLITLVACGAAGYSWWQLKQHQEGAQPVAKELPPAAPVFIDGEKSMTLRGENIVTEFHSIVERYIAQRFGTVAGSV